MSKLVSFSVVAKEFDLRYDSVIRAYNRGSLYGDNKKIDIENVKNINRLRQMKNRSMAKSGETSDEMVSEKCLYEKMLEFLTHD